MHRLNPVLKKKRKITYLWNNLQTLFKLTSHCGREEWYFCWDAARKKKIFKRLEYFVQKKKKKRDMFRWSVLSVTCSSRGKMNDICNYITENEMTRDTERNRTRQKDSMTVRHRDMAEKVCELNNLLDRKMRQIASNMYIFQYLIQ